MADVLQSISDEDLPKLIEVLKQHFPTSVAAHNWISKQKKWEKTVPNLKVHVFCPNGDWKSGIVVAFADGLAGEGRKYGVMYAPEGEADKVLSEALMKTTVIPWKTMMHFSSVFERHIGAATAAAEAAGIKLPPLQPLSHLLFCPQEMASQLPLPKPKIPNARVGRLSRDNLEEVWGLGSAFGKNMKPVLGTTMDLNPAYAVFVQKEDGTEMIASACMEMEHGGLGMGNTHPDFQRKGLQVMLGAYIMKDMGTEGNSVSAFTTLDNIGIINGGKQVGLQPVGKIIRFDVSPGGDS